MANKCENLSSWSFLESAILKNSCLLVPMRRYHGRTECVAPGGIKFHAIFLDSGEFCIPVVVKLISSKVVAVLVKLEMFSL